MMIYFITAAEEILYTQGIQGVTIRNVAEKAGYSSGTLYNYFEDLDELILFASLKSFKNYANMLCEAAKHSENELAFYYNVLGLFMKMSFENPDIFMNLFYGKHSPRLNAIINEYYCLFPGELLKQRNNIAYAEIINKLMKEGSMLIRDTEILTAVANAGLIKKDSVAHLALIMTALEESYINRLCGRNRDGADKEALYEEFMTLAHVVVELCR